MTQHIISDLIFKDIMEGYDMDEIIPVFEQTIFHNSVGELSDLLELGIDSVLDEGLVQSFPIFSFLIGAKNIAQNIKDRNLLLNTANFITKFNSGTIEEVKLIKYKNKLNNPKTAEQELGRVIILLDKFIDKQKSSILGTLFRKYVDGDYPWEKFCELSDILNRLFLHDLTYLNDFANAEDCVIDYNILEIPYNLRRLESLGLVEIYGQYSRFGDKLLQGEIIHTELTENGKVFANL